MNSLHRFKICNVIGIAIFASGFLVASCKASAPVQRQTPSVIKPNANIITACKQTVFDYAHSRDAVDLEANGALFTANATLSLGPTTFNGREEIMAGLADRGPKEFTRHVIASVSVDVKDDGTVMGKSYALVYITTPREDENKPIMLEIISPKVILTYNDTFDVTDNRCLIAKRTVSLDLVAKNEQ